MSLMGTQVRIVLADDHQMMLEGLRNMLAEQPGFDVVAQVRNGRDAVRAVNQHEPHVVIMDVTMPDLNGIEATRQIKMDHPQVQVIGLSMHVDREFVTEMLAAGASGYLLKDCPFNELVAAIQAVIAGETYLSSKVAGLVVKGCVDQSAGANRFWAGVLTPREREILQLVADGKSTKEIAAMLDLSGKTVDSHRRQVMEKLKIYSVAELTHYAIREGLTALH